MQSGPTPLKSRTLLYSRLRYAGALALLGAASALPAAAQTYNANTDYNTDLVAGTNPNGVWTYGWSTSPATALHLYTQHHVVSLGPTANAWDDPAHLTSHVPVVYKNTGGDYPDDGNVSIPAGALILHGGGPDGSGGFANDFSHVLFTAPAAGSYALTSSFQLRQHVTTTASVQVLQNGVSVFSSSLPNFLDTASYTHSFLLNPGDRLDFAVGYATPPNGTTGNSVQLASNITRTLATNTPEPGALSLLLGAGTVGGMLLRRRRSRKTS